MDTVKTLESLLAIVMFDTDVRTISVDVVIENC